MRSVFRQLILISLVAAVFASPLLASPAHACSCAMPSDIAAWLDESEAAFVGTMIDKRDAAGGEFGQESIYTFEVDQWVKGNAGNVIEVRSASNGAACGFEFWDEDNRTGAIVYEEDGELHGSLCSQVDAEVLLAASNGHTSPASTTPPLVLEPVDVDGVQTNVRLIAGIAVAIVVIGMIWLAVNTRARPPAEDG